MQNPSIPDHSVPPAARLAPEAASSPPDTPPAPSPDLSRNDSPRSAQAASSAETATRPREIGGRDGPEPTRFGDWEKAGRCIDF
jgi:hypothetical protein